jgi:hypothetical protein
VKGYRVFLRNIENAMIRERGIPHAADTRNPPKLSSPVIQVYFKISGKFWTNFTAMPEGAGRRYMGTSKSLIPPSQRIKNKVR